MPGLSRASTSSNVRVELKTWMAGTSPAMTLRNSPHITRRWAYWAVRSMIFFTRSTTDGLVVCSLLDQRLYLSAAGEFEINLTTLRVGDELRVVHGLLECGPQEPDKRLRHAGRRQIGPAEILAAENEVHGGGIVLGARVVVDPGNGFELRMAAAGDLHEHVGSCRP